MRSASVAAASKNKAQESYEKIPLDRAKSSFTFEGYGPSGSERCAFGEWIGFLYVKAGRIVGGEGVIKAASVKTGIGKLDSHLKSADFFDVEHYPEIRFKSAVQSGEEAQGRGELTFRGITRDVAFPVKVTAKSISADFLFDTRPFGIPYAGMKPEVRIIFTLIMAQG